MLKRISIVLVVSILLSTVFCVPAYAEEDNTDYADVLYTLGLFNGVGADPDGLPIYDLDRAPTRQESLAMLIRLLGKDHEALSKEWQHPFTDVDSWADNYVGYAYQTGLTNGISASKFGSKNIATEQQYATFLLRSLGYSENFGDFEYAEAINKAYEVGIVEDTNESGAFLREDVVRLSYNALLCSLKGSAASLAERLLNEGVYSTVQVINTGDQKLQSILPLNVDEKVNFDMVGQNPGSIVYNKDYTFYIVPAEYTDRSFMGHSITKENIIKYDNVKKKSTIIYAGNGMIEQMQLYGDELFFAEDIFLYNERTQRRQYSYINSINVKTNEAKNYYKTEYAQYGIGVWHFMIYDNKLYAECWEFGTTRDFLVQIDINSRKSTELSSFCSMENTAGSSGIIGIYDNRIYYRGDGEEGLGIYAYDLKTKKQSFLKDEYGVIIANNLYYINSTSSIIYKYDLNLNKDLIGYGSAVAYAPTGTKFKGYEFAKNKLYYTLQDHKALYVVDEYGKHEQVASFYVVPVIVCVDRFGILTYSRGNSLATLRSNKPIDLETKLNIDESSVRYATRSVCDAVTRYVADL